MKPYEILTDAAALAATLKARRKAIGVTQDDLASLHALSRYAIIDAESGKGDPKFSTITTILEGLGLRLVAVPAEFAGRITLPEPMDETQGKELEDGDPLEFDGSWIDE